MRDNELRGLILEERGNSVSKWVASSRRSLIAFRVSRHRITNTITGMQSCCARGARPSDGCAAERCMLKDYVLVATPTARLRGRNLALL
jgi:hypothetical protein